MSEEEFAEIRKRICEYIDLGWICPSTSLFSDPNIFIRKKGILQMCIDYRLLNKETKIDAYSIPRIDKLLD